MHTVALPGAARAVVAALLLLCLTVTVTGCPNPNGGDNEQTRVALHIFSWPAGFDVHATSDAGTAQTAGAAVYPLYGYDMDGQLEGWIADGMATSVDGDTKRWRIKIKPVPFSDGTKADARIVAANIARVCGFDDKFTKWVPKGKTVKADYQGTFLDVIADVDVVDEKTIELETKIDKGIERFLAHWAMGIQAEVSLTGKAEHPTGYGPYVFKQITTNQSIVLTRNPNYDFPAGVHAPDVLNIRVGGDDTSRINTIKDGETDIMLTVPSEVLLKPAPAGYRFVKTELEAVCVCVTGSQLPREVRRAVARAVWDARASTVEVIQEGMVIGAPLPLSMSESKLTPPEVSDEELTAARAYLREHGLTLLGPPMDRHWIKNNSPALQSVKDALQAMAGDDVEIKASHHEWSDYVKTFLTGIETDAVFLAGWGWDVRAYAPEAVTAWLSMTRDADGNAIISPKNNLPQWVSERALELFEQGKHEDDTEAIVGVFQLALDEGAITPICSRFMTSLVREGVSVVVDPSGGPAFETISVK